MDKVEPMDGQYLALTTKVDKIEGISATLGNILVETGKLSGFTSQISGFS